MNKSQIRSATKKDLSVIQEIARRTIDKRYRSFLGDESVDWFINSGASDREIQKYLGNCYILEEDAELVAFIMFFKDLIHLMMVDETKQNSGRGTRLLTFAEKQLIKEGNKSIRLETLAGNHQAIEFYKKNGWSVSEQEPDKEFSFIRMNLVKKFD